MHRLFVVMGFVFAVAACGGSGGAPDGGGPMDSGHTPDASTPDGGENPDGSVPDAGNGGGSGDSGQPMNDAGQPDSGGLGDGGVVALVPVLPCTDSIASVYIAPTGLPAFTPSARGDIVRCAHDYTLDAGGVQSQLSGKNIAPSQITATSGTDVFRIAYRTEHRDGGEAIGTAKLFLPSNRIASQLPVIVAAHGSDGIADSCAPSMGLTDSAELTMPFAAQGYAVIAPDYAGLGNEGIQAYLDARETAYSTLDAARALRKLIAPGAFTSQVAITGHSQGGGAALAAQALVKTYGADGELGAVAVFAAEYQTRLNSFGYVTAMGITGQNVGTITNIALGVAKPPIYEMRQYALEVNFFGDADGLDGFPAAKAQALVNAINTDCLVALGAAIPATSVYVSDLTDDTLRTGFLSCVDGGTCTSPGKEMFDYLNDNILEQDSTGAPILYVQGLSDIIMVPNEEAACNVIKLTGDGAAPTVCVDSSADHTSVVTRNAAYAVSWVAARLAGQQQPPCAYTTALPTCTP